jgi:hypothetical protein
MQYFLSPRDFLNNPALRANLLYLFHEKASSKEAIANLSFSMNQGKSLYQRWVRIEGTKRRILSVPNDALKFFLQMCVLDFIKTPGVHECCHGGEVGWSPKKSLETHLPLSCALSFDLKSAFQNTDFKMIFNFFYLLLGNFFPGETRRQVSGFFL